MAAYQCLKCHKIEHGVEDCCEAPDLFCINDMPEAILKMREALVFISAHDCSDWPERYRESVRRARVALQGVV